MGRNKKTLIGLGVVLASVALAQNVQKTLTLMINGNKSTTNAIVVEGKNYVSVDALKAAGATASLNGSTLSLNLPKAPVVNTQTSTNQGQGGANQLKAVEGCMNELLFNGIWRVKTTKVEYVKSKEYGTYGDEFQSVRVTWEMRNGTARTINPEHTGAALRPDWGLAANELNNFSLVLSDGQVIKAAQFSQYGIYQDKFDDQQLPPGAAIIGRMIFLYPKDMTSEEISKTKAAKLLVEFDKNFLQKYPDTKNLAYTAGPTIRMDLSCSK